MVTDNKSVDDGDFNDDDFNDDDDDEVDDEDCTGGKCRLFGSSISTIGSNGKGNRDDGVDDDVEKSVVKRDVYLTSQGEEFNFAVAIG